MAKTRPAGAWVMARIYGTQDQKEFSNEFWYSIFSGAPTSSWDHHAAAGAFFTAIGTPLIATMSTHCRLLGCDLFYNDGTGTIGAAWYQTLNSSSINVGIPEDIAVVVQKLTANSGPGDRGRWYFAGIDVTFVKDSYLTASGLTVYQSLAQELKTNITDQGIVYSPAHLKLKGGAVLEPLKDTPVVALLATRRRRRFGF